MVKDEVSESNITNNDIFKDSTELNENNTVSFYDSAMDMINQVRNIRNIQESRYGEDIFDFNNEVDIVRDEYALSFIQSNINDSKCIFVYKKDTEEIIGYINLSGDIHIFDNKTEEYENLFSLIKYNIINKIYL
jgi:hypothetical protein